MTERFARGQELSDHAVDIDSVRRVLVVVGAGTGAVFSVLLGSVADDAQ